MNRELWLTTVAQRLEPWFKRKGYSVGRYRLTCGWPCQRALATKARTIGECHSQLSSKDGTSEIFISPSLDDPLVVGGVMAHELLHAAVGVQHKHKGLFIVGMKHLDLVGKPTMAYPGEKLLKEIEAITKAVGPYPHKALNPIAHLVKKPEWAIKLVCPDCDCNFRISRCWIEQSGYPLCGCGTVMEEALILEDPF